ncbi:hypothetical protein [Mycobacterium riyadhense]|nr:hypothetical protein [Mycobacterium riyadhense]MCV7146154.1 hypothetical protein [Mycobacterium riyadhense]
MRSNRSTRLALVTALLAFIVCVWPSKPRVQPVRLTDAAIKEPLRGLISMGAYKFAPVLGEPDNSLDTVR